MTGDCPDTHGETKPRTEALGMEGDASSGHFDYDLKMLVLALIAAQFMTAGDEETEKLRKGALQSRERRIKNDRQLSKFIMGISYRQAPP